MKYVIILLLLPFCLSAQDSNIFEQQWTLYPNFDLKKNIKSGDSLVFIVNDSTMYNPAITLEVDKNRKATSCIISYAHPTEKGIVTSTNDPAPSYTVTRKTIVKEGSIETIEYTTENSIQVSQGPAMVRVCILDDSLHSDTFSCDIIIGYGKDDFISGPFRYVVINNQLILIKQ